MKTVTSWQLKARGSAQAGNRASKTRRYLQWWDSDLECIAVTSVECNILHYTFSLVSCISGPFPSVRVAAWRRCGQTQARVAAA